MRHSGRTLNYLERISLSDVTHMMSMADLVAISIETQRIDSGCSLEKQFIELIHKNHRMVLYLTINHVDLCHGYVCGLLT